MGIERVCVFGAGTLGWQIALQCASHAHSVNLYDISSEALKNARRNIENELGAWVEAGTITAKTRETTIQQVRFEQDPAKALEGVDLVIEAVPERLALK